MQTEKKVVELDINDVLPNRFQPRIKFDENSINELAESIKKYGVIQPIVVRKIGEKYEIIAGERRYKASVMAGKPTIPAIVSELNDKESVEIALIENVQREDLTPIEKAISYKKILDMGYMNQEDLAQKVGKSQSAIANTLRLLGLTEEVQEALLESKISERHARSLLKLKDDRAQVVMLNKIINERLTVRRTDEEIEKMIENNNETPITIFDNVQNGATGSNGQMYNNQFNNIPNAPIYNTNVNQGISNEVELPKYDVPNAPIHNESNVIAPGFMDINKIEQTAQDIIQPEKPSADLNTLLQPDVNTVSYNQQPEESDDELLRPGKFFNFFDDNNSESTEGGFVAPASINPSPVEMPTYEVPTQPMYTAPVEPTPTPVEMPTYEVPTQPMYTAPVEPTPTPVEMPTYEVPTQPMYTAPIEQINIPEANNNTFVVSDIRTIVNTVRDCANTIEKAGFKVDVEEIDFEDSYQVIFKIDKK